MTVSAIPAVTPWTSRLPISMFEKKEMIDFLRRYQADSWGTARRATEAICFSAFWAAFATTGVAALAAFCAISREACWRSG
ncbi:hypothetical protein D3C72_1781220 [compost metagenome]